MALTKKQETPEVEKLSSVFFKENDPKPCLKRKFEWQDTPSPDFIQVQPMLEKLRQVKQVIDEIDEEFESFKLDLAENNKIETVRKENVFSEEVTESEMDIIQQRVALQQRQFKEYERREHIRKSKKIKTVYDYLSEEEIAAMLEDCSHNEEEVIGRMSEGGYLYGIRKEIAIKHTPEETESSSSSMTAEQQLAYQQLLKKRSETLKKTTNDSAKKQYRMGGRLGLDEAIKQIQENNVDPEKAFEGWSQARIRAYQMIDQNPNSYYYRFNAPGEVQRKGQWAEDERKIFFERLAEVGANGQWGIFAMKIPGRVGYQCSNFYRLLVETNEIQDPNYVLDAKGKAHYLFDKKTADGNTEKTFRTHSKHGTGRASGVPSSSSSSTAAAVPASAATTTTTRRSRASASTSAAITTTTKKTSAAKKKRRRGWNSDDDEDEDDFEDYNDTSGTYTESSRASRSTRRTRARMDYNDDADEVVDDQGEDSDDDQNLDNPLPGFLDPITLDEVVKPAISTYGHVMGYDSWVRCLTNWEGKKNICPLTKKPLTKRDLVILTHDNIEEYKDKIIQ